MNTDMIVAIVASFAVGVLVDQEFNDPLKHGCLPFPDDRKIQSAPAGPPLSSAACAHAVSIGRPWQCV